MRSLIEPDEADEVAETLRRKPLSDRIAEVKRRLAELAGRDP